MLIHRRPDDEEDLPGDATPDDPIAAWRRWLDRNERETWQMELLVSGFAIVLLAEAHDPLHAYLEVIRANGAGSRYGSILTFAVDLFARMAWAIALASLVVGALLRSLWIASIGVRSFSGGIDWTQFDLDERFKAFLSRRIPDFDTYIVSLERLSSSIFALTFLLVFAALGIAVAAALGGLALMGLAGLAVDSGIDRNTGGLVIVLIILALAVPVIFYVVDFFTGGSMKRRGGITRVYYPIYRLLGWMTGARFYRPLYYNLVDNAFGRRLVLLIVPYIVVLLALQNFRGELFTSEVPRAGVYGVGTPDGYASLHAGDITSRPYISDPIATGKFLGLHLPMSRVYQRLFTRSCDSLAARYATRTDVAADRVKSRQLADATLDCISSRLLVELDGEPLEGLEYMLLARSENYPAELLTTFRIDSLAPGRHTLHLARIDGDGDLHDHYTIPFLRP